MFKNCIVFCDYSFTFHTIFKFILIANKSFLLDLSFYKFIIFTAFCSITSPRQNLVHLRFNNRTWTLIKRSRFFFIKYIVSNRNFNNNCLSHVLNHPQRSIFLCSDKILFFFNSSRNNYLNIHFLHAGLL